jgi:leucyl/phenylalanyl-tRNA---protein transferase
VNSADELAPVNLLNAYARGYFPMATSRHGELLWYAPDPRGILPLDAFHIPKNLRKTVDRQTFRVTTDRAFRDVIAACAERPDTWISDEIAEAYTRLHTLGFAHSIECWQKGRLVGGLYGVALRSAFFGESMFHLMTDASKVALVHLVDRLRTGGFTLLDIQYTTPHLEQFGAVEIPEARYKALLRRAMSHEASWRAIERESGEIIAPDSDNANHSSPG